MVLINKALERVAYKITLPVAIRIVMGILQELYPKKDPVDLYDMVLFTSNPSMGFQKSDIKFIHFTIYREVVQVEIMLNFLSIFGASSPLPMHYSEKVLSDLHEKKVLLNFLDMLNHRLKRLIYPIWENQRYYMQFRPDLKDRFSKYVLSISGLYSQSQLHDIPLDLHKLLPFSGMLSMHQKSTISLLAILRHYFEHERITIDEAIVSKATLPEEQKVKLGGANCDLGVNMSIGTFVITRNLKFRIKFDQIRWSELEEFSAGGKKIRELNSLIHLVQSSPLGYEVVVTISSEEIRPSTLGDYTRLGINGWIGKVGGDQTIVIAQK